MGRQTLSLLGVLTVALALLPGDASADISRSYVYNAADQLVEVRESGVTVAAHVYDGEGERIRRSGGGQDVIYVRDPGGNVLAEYDGSGNLIAEYVYLAGQKVARIAAGGAATYYHADHLGTPRAITNASGQVTWQGEHEPFGEEHASTGARSDAYTFTGHEDDAGIDLLYMHARYYDPEVGRFITTDPVGGDPANPQSWNRYSYVLNNPMGYVDPDGEWAFPWEALDAYSYCQSASAWAAAWTRFTRNPGWGTGFEAAVKLGYATVDAAGLMLPAVPAVAGLSMRATDAVATTVTGALGKPVIIGENMKRVNAYARKVGGETIDDWLAGRQWTQELNDEFIATVKAQGRQIHDIGPDFSRRLRNRVDPTQGAGPSSAYGAERRDLVDYENYQRLYERTGKYEGGVPGFDQ